jgi:regulator of protease activity HflC (stomatin/prohibitin superfamily)
MRLPYILSIAAAFLLLIATILGSWYTVDQTERGVILRNGALAGTAQPGLGFKLPWFDAVEKISIKTSTFSWDRMDTYSYDQQQAHLKVSVTLHAAPEKVGELYSRFGSLAGAVSELLAPHVNQQVKVVFGQYTAVRAIQTRAKLNSDIKDAITASLTGGDVLVVESVQLENIEFSTAYLKSIEQRMLAEVEVQQLQQNAEREKVQAQITVTKANAQADALRADAKAKSDAAKLAGDGAAYATTVRGEAEASAIRARAAALASNQNLVQLVQAERWNGALPTTMIPGTAVPMLNLEKAAPPAAPAAK